MIHNTDKVIAVAENEFQKLHDEPKEDGNLTFWRCREHRGLLSVRGRMDIEVGAEVGGRK